MNHKSGAHFLVACVVLWSAVLLITFGNQNVCHAQGLEKVAAAGQRKVVKIYGAGGFQSLEGYQSGFFVSDDGLVLTAWSYVLDPESIRVVDHLGQVSEATLVGFDPETEIALLATGSRPTDYFTIGQSRRLSVGRRVLALSNLFNVAVGDEDVSVQAGIVSAVTSLQAAQRALKTPYHGPVYYIDAMSNNPGSSGGALIDAEGNLAGMLGRELADQSGGFWINYAIPVDVVAERMQRIQNGAGEGPRQPAENQPLEPMSMKDVGVILVPRLTLHTPAYVERVSKESPAAKAGLMADDLILKVQGKLTTDRDQVIEQVKMLDKFSQLKLTVRRGDEVLEMSILP